MHACSSDKKALLLRGIERVFISLPRRQNDDFLAAGIAIFAQIDRDAGSVYDFSIFMNLMFSGLCIYCVAAITSLVGQFVDPEM